MKTGSIAFVVALTWFLACPRPAEAQAVRFRHVASVYADAQGAGLNVPEAVACGASGEVVIGDTGNDRLLRFTYGDKTFSGGAEIRSPEVQAPIRVRLDSKGEIYVLDGVRKRIAHLAPDGVFKNAITFAGVPEPATVVPKSFAIDSSDNIFVLDAFASRVLVLNAQGQFQKALPLPEDAAFAADLAVDATGTVFLVDAVKRRIFSARKEATSFTPLGGDLTEYIATLPTHIAASKGTILVVEGNGSRVIGFGRDGSFLSRQLSMGWNEGALNHPSQICITDKDEVFIADRDNSRVQVFQLLR